MLYTKKQSTKIFETNKLENSFYKIAGDLNTPFSITDRTSGQISKETGVKTTL